MENTQERLIDRLAVNPREVAELMGVSTPTVYNLLNKADGIPSFTVGNRRLIPVDALRSWLADQVNRGA